MAGSQLENLQIASRYAKALFEAASEQGFIDAVKNDIESLGTLLSEVPSLTDYFANPLVSADEKKALVEKQLNDNLHSLTCSVLGLLQQNDRLGLLSELVQTFTTLAEAKAGIGRAELTVPVKIPAKLEKQLQTSLEKQLGYNRVELTTVVDPAILAGAVLKIGDKIIDGSYAGKLETLRKQVG